MAPLLDLDQSEPLYIDQLDENEVERYYNELLGFNIEAEENTQHLRFLLVLCRNILQLKATQTQVAFEELEQIAAEKAKISTDKEQALIDEIDELKQQLSVLRRQTGEVNLSKDAEPLKEEIRFLTEENQRLQRDFVELRNDLSHEKEKAARHEGRSEQFERELRDLRKEKDQLTDDVRDYQRQVQNQRENVSSRRTETEDYQKKLRLKNQELLQIVDENNNLSSSNEALRLQVKQLTVTLEESVKQMETTTDRYAKIKVALDESDMVIEKLEEENAELLKKLSAAGVVTVKKTSYEDELILEFNKKVEEWKTLFQERDEELHDYKKKLEKLQQEILQYQMDSDRVSILQLSKAVDSRDKQINQLKIELENTMREMEQNSKIMEELQDQMNSGDSITQIQNRRVQELQNALKFKENQTLEALNRTREAEKNAIEKDRSIIDLTNRMRRYEMGEYGLSEAVDEVRELKSLLETKEKQNVDLIQQCSKIELHCVELLDENEILRHRLGIDAGKQSTIEFKQFKQIQQETDRALNIILQKEVERLEDERIALKIQARKMARKLGEKAVALGLTADETLVVDQFAEDLKRRVITRVEATEDHSQSKSMDRVSAVESDNDQRNLLQDNRILKRKLLQFERENQELINGLREIKDQLNSGTLTAADPQINVPTLDKLLAAIETAHFSENREAYLHMKSEIDLSKGRVEEQRSELKSARVELRVTLVKLSNVETELQSANEQIEEMKRERAAFSLYQTIKLPDDTSPSTSAIIVNLNEQLIKVLHELDTKSEQIRELDESSQLCNVKLRKYEQEIESSKREYDKLHRELTFNVNKLTNDLSDAKENLENLNMKSVEFDRLADSLSLGENDLKRRLAEMSRKCLANGIGCKSLTRKLASASQSAVDLRKENEILKTEIRQAEKSLIEQAHVIEREKEIANYQVSCLQKLTENAMPLSDYQKLANLNANLTEKYQSLLRKAEHDLIRKSNSEAEIENTFWKKELEYLTRQLQIEKEKSHKLTLALEANYDRANLSDADSGVGSISELSSVSQKLSALEMKELNERQRADHFRKMYDETRHQMNIVEGRNAALEAKFESLSNIYNELQVKERQHQDEMTDLVPRSTHEADNAKILVLEENCLHLKLEIDKLAELLEISQHQSNYFEKTVIEHKLEVDEMNSLLRDLESQTDFSALNTRLHKEIVRCKLNETSACFDLKIAKEKICKLKNVLKVCRRQCDDENRLFSHVKYEYSVRIQRLRSIIADLRHRFSGSIPLKEQERLTEMLRETAQDRQKIRGNLYLIAEKENKISLKVAEIDEKDTILDEMLKTIKDTTVVSKVVEWKQKLEKSKICHQQDKMQSMRLFEEITMQKNIIKKLEDIVQALEAENRQMWNQWEERESMWEEQEAVLEKRLQKIFIHEEIDKNIDQVFDYSSYLDESIPLDELLRKALDTLKSQAKVINELKSTSEKYKKEFEIKIEEKRKLEYDLFKKDNLLLEMKKLVEPSKILKLNVEEISSTTKEENIGSTFSHFSDIQQQFRRLFEQNEQLWKSRLTQKDDAIDGYRQMIENLQSNLNESNLTFQTEIGRLADKISALEMEKFSEEIRIRRENFQMPIELTISYDDAENYVVKTAQVETNNSVLEAKLLEFIEQIRFSNEKMETLGRENEMLHLELEETKGILNQQNTEKDLAETVKPPRLNLETKSESEESSNTKEIHERDSLPDNENHQLTEKPVKSKKTAPTLPSVTDSISTTQIIELKKADGNFIWKNKFRQLERRYKENLVENENMAAMIVSLKNDMMQTAQRKTKEAKDVDNREKDVLDFGRELKSMEHKLEEKTSELDECKHTNNMLRTTVRDAELELDLARTTTTKLRKENDRLKNELKSMEIRLKHSRGLSKEKGVFSTQTDELRRKLEELQGKLKLHENKAEDTDESRRSRSEIFYKWNEGKKLQEKIDRLVGQLDSKNKECEATQKILVRMRERIEKLEKNQSHALKTLSKKNLSLSDVSCQTLFVIENSLVRAVNGNADDGLLSRQLDELRVKNEVLSRKCTELESKVQKAVKNGDNKNGDKSENLIESLQRLLEEAYKERENLKHDVEEYKFLKSEFDEVKKRYNSLKCKYDDLTLENLGLKDEIDQVGKASKWDVVSRLHARIDELDSENKNLNSQLEDLKFSTARTSDSDLQKLIRENRELKEKLTRAAPRVAWSEEISYTNASDKNAKIGTEIDRKSVLEELVSVKKQLVQLRFENQRLKMESIRDTKGIERLDTHCMIGRLCRHTVNLNSLKNKTIRIIELEQLLKQEIERKHAYIAENRRLSEKVDALQWTPDEKESSDCDILLEQIRKLKLEMVELEEKQASMTDEIQIVKRRIEPILIENEEIDVPALKERFRMYDRILKENIDLKLKCNKLEARLLN